MSAESAQPTYIHGLGRQLRDLAADPSSEFFVYGETVLRPEPNISMDKLPIFAEIQQETCATSGIAHVLYFPRHLRR